MDFETVQPPSEKGESSAENSELIRELGFIGAALENIISGKEVDFEKELAKVGNLFESLADKHRHDQKLIRNIYKWQNRITMIAYGLGAFVAYQAGYVPGNFISGATVSMGGMGLSWYNDIRKDKAVDARTEKLESDIREVITETRNFADVYFISKGAIKEGEIMHLTEDQKANAKKEMERDFSGRRADSDS
ncbi:MAG: hypothetical protein HY433_02200 [Candidatus Liptonbacteria bacterium]|nr:hypothetical protein [Candidatus Liptonbacteria bacterium]